MTDVITKLQTIVEEATEYCTQMYQETFSDAHSEEETLHECDGMTVCPTKLSGGSQEELEDNLEQNMLLRDLGRGDK